MKSTTIFLIIVALIIIVGGAYYFMDDSQPIPPPVEINTPATTTISSTTKQAQKNNATSSPATSTPSTPASVTLNASGFSPSTITISKGTKVTWINAGTGSMWVASDLHPNHTQYDNTQRSEHCAAGYTRPIPFDECKDVKSYNFTFNQTGTWKYHNHLNPTQTGVIVVK